MSAEGPCLFRKVGKGYPSKNLGILESSDCYVRATLASAITGKPKMGNLDDPATCAVPVAVVIGESNHCMDAGNIRFVAQEHGSLRGVLRISPD